jgi:hypothetical protein
MQYAATLVHINLQPLLQNLCSRYMKARNVIYQAWLIYGIKKENIQNNDIKDDEMSSKIP